MNLASVVGTDRGDWLWAASVARSLLFPEPPTRTTWQGERHPCALWWGPVTMVETGDIMYSFKNVHGQNCIEWVERPLPPEPQ